MQGSAAGGLGAEAARVLAAHGAKIAVVDINNQAAEKVANDICARGGEAIAVATDISQEASVKSMSEQVISRFGQIDILHNNAAILSNEQRQGDIRM